MEPRPPRPRQQYLPNDAAASGTFPRTSANPEQGLYAPPPGYAAPPAYPPELDLVPRRDRHRQRIARNILISLLAIVALGAIGWTVRDRFFTAPPDDQNLAQIAPTEPADSAIVVADTSPAAGEEPPTQAPLVNNLLATSTPTPPPANQQAGAADAEGDETEAGNDAADPAAPTQPAAQPSEDIDVAALMPTAEELPVQGLSSTGSGERSLSEVAATFGSAEAAAEAEQFLTDLGWSENVFVDFAAGDPSLLAPDATTVLTVSVHEFADQAAASEALPYFSNVVVAVQGFSEGQADPIGDEIRLLRGVSEDGTTNVAAYIVDGPLLYRIGGSSPAGDPTGHVLQLAADLINGQ